MKQRWYFLIHQIPPKPLYLRAKVRQQLAKVGAVALKNSVYLLPRTADTLEDFQWIAQEIASNGGRAWISEGELLGGIDDDELIAAFHAERSADYGQLRTDLAELSKRLGRGATSPPDELSRLNRLRERYAEIRALDFFDSPSSKEVEAMVASLDDKLARPASARRRQDLPRRPQAQTWVTRTGIKVDRIASAWLIRRYIDPKARFRFVDAVQWAKSSGEIAFDIVGGDYTHEGDRCTFETLTRKFTIRSRPVTAIAEIVHDIDLKDGKFGRNEVSGVQLMIQGLIAAHPTDEARLERGLAMFDELAQALERPQASQAPRRTPKRASRKTKRRTS